MRSHAEGHSRWSTATPLSLFFFFFSVRPSERTVCLRARSSPSPSPVHPVRCHRLSYGVYTIAAQVFVGVLHDPRSKEIRPEGSRFLRRAVASSTTSSSRPSAYTGSFTFCLILTGFPTLYPVPQAPVARAQNVPVSTPRYPSPPGHQVSTLVAGLDGRNQFLVTSPTPLKSWSSPGT